MECKNIIVLLIVVTIFLPMIASAKEFMVGDDKGWGFGVDYAVWAKGKNFKSGDKLIFKYAAADHDVVKVNGKNFQACTVSAKSKSLTSGKDVVTLVPGNHMFLCSKIGHCDAGMKLSINVA